MRSRQRNVAKRIAQVLLALLLSLVVVQSAFAADGCDCPACPVHACMHGGCLGGDDGATCLDAGTDACPNAVAMPVAPAAVKAVPAPASADAVAVATWVGIAADSRAARCLSSPRFAALPAHIVFCRLLR